MPIVGSLRAVGHLACRRVFALGSSHSWAGAWKTEVFHAASRDGLIAARPVGTLIGGTALAVCNNSGIWVVQPGLLGIGLVLVVQFIGFVLATEWTMDGTEW